jgi:hypothetical protein
LRKSCPVAVVTALADVGSGADRVGVLLHVLVDPLRLPTALLRPCDRLGV